MVEMEYDKYLSEKLGEIGLYQSFILFMLTLEETFLGINSVTSLFIAQSPDHYCKIDDEPFKNCTEEETVHFTIPLEERNGEVVHSRCSMYDRNYTTFTAGVCPYLNASQRQNMETLKCTAWKFDTSIISSSVVTEWSLVCDRAAIALTVGAVFQAGRLVGSLLFGDLIDRFGRKRMLIVGGILCSLSGIGFAFSPNYIVMLTLRFFLGLFSAGKTIAANVAVLEFVGVSWRVFAGNVYYGGFSCGYMVLSGWAFLIRDWRYLQCSISTVELLLYLSYIVAIPESPRWLLVKNRKDEAHAILKKIAKCNKISLESDVEITVQSEKQTGSYVDLVRFKCLRLTTFPMLFIVMTIAFLYYGISLNTSSLAGDIYINTFLSGAVELPVIVISVLFSKRLDRTKLISASMITAAAVMFLALAIPNDARLFLNASAFCGKILVLVAYNMFYVLSLEMFPTSIRSIGFGAVNVAAKLASTLSAYVGLLFEVHIVLAFVVLGVPAAVAGLLVLMMPETRGKPLHQTLEEGELFALKHSCMPCKKLLSLRYKRKHYRSTRHAQRNNEKEAVAPCGKEGDIVQGALL